MDIPFALHAGAGAPLHRQLYTQLRQAILDGRLRPGQRLPSTRALAEQLKLARNTVADAYDQLLSEGYVEGRQGSGTYVASALPDDVLGLRRDRPSGVVIPSGRRLSAWAMSLPSSPFDTNSGAKPRWDFRPGLPDLAAFPWEVWARLTSRRLKHTDVDAAGYGDAAGYHPLREAIAAYLGAARAVRCTPEQVVVVSGSQQALDLAARLCLDPGDSVVVEEPGYNGAQRALAATQAELVPIPVDQQGLDIERLATTPAASRARLVYVTPSHQYPTGVTLPLTRRLALLRWATEHEALILEDDYDSELRYRGASLESLQGLAVQAGHGGVVLYIGTFSKVMFPALRVGYVVAPPDLVGPLVTARWLADRHGTTLPQQTLTDFITEGHFERHLRRMRSRYASRQAALVEALEHYFGDQIEFLAPDAGMHLAVYLRDRLAAVGDMRLTEAAREAGINLYPLSRYFAGLPSRPGLMIGYASQSEDDIQAGIARLATVARACVNRIEPI